MNGIEAAFIGRCGRDAELRFTANGQPLVTCGVAVSEIKRDDSVKTQWLDVVVFKEDLLDIMTKGARIYVEGKLELRQWEDRDGNPKSKLSLTAWKVEPVGRIGERRPKRGEPVSRVATDDGAAPEVETDGLFED